MRARQLSGQSRRSKRSSGEGKKRGIEHVHRTGPALAAIAAGAVLLGVGVGAASNERTPRLRVIGRVSTGGQPTGLAYGAGSVWVANYGNGTVARIDPKRNRITARIDVQGSPYGVAFGAGSVWMSSFDTSFVTRIDPTTNQVIARIDVGG